MNEALGIDTGSRRTLWTLAAFLVACAAPLASPVTAPAQTVVWEATLTVGAASADEYGAHLGNYGRKRYGQLDNPTIRYQGHRLDILLIDEHRRPKKLVIIFRQDFPKLGSDLTLHVTHDGDTVSLPFKKQGFRNQLAYKGGFSQRWQSGDTVALTITTTEPGAPKNVEAACEDGDANLSWAAPDSIGGSVIVGYQYRQKMAGYRYGPWTAVPVGLTSHRVYGLTYDAAYAFQLRALNGSGTGLSSSEATCTPRTSPGTPGAPRNLTATPKQGTTTAVTLGWSPPDIVNSPVLTGYQYRQRTENGPYGPWTDIADSASLTRHDITGLTAGEAYTFQLRALNSAGQGPDSNQASSTTGVPGTPNHLAATPKTTTTAALSWSPPDSFGASAVTGYQYRQRLGGGPYGSWTDITNSASLTRYDVNGLTAGASYTFQLRAENASGSGSGSNEAFTNLGVSGGPGAPTNLTGIPTAPGYLRLTWTDPASDGGSPVTRYQYRKKVAGKAYSWWRDEPHGRYIDLTDTRISLWEIDYLGVRLVFQVRAVNANGHGPASNETTVTPQNEGPPDAPVDLTAEARPGEVALSWTRPWENLAPIRKYQIRQKSGSGPFGDWSDIPGSGRLTKGYTVTGLANGATYTFEVRAVNQLGNWVGSVGPGHGLAASVQATPRAAPSAPEDLTARAGDRRVTLRWTTPFDGGSAIRKYQVRQKAGTGSFGSWTDIPNSGPETTSHTAPNLTNDTVYTFEVRAVNGIGAGARAGVQAVAGSTRPGAPTNLAAQAGDARVTLNWTTPYDGGSSIRKYQVRQKAGAGPFGDWADIPDSGPDTTSHTVQGLIPGTAYLFEVRAVNAEGNGLEAQARATPFEITAPGAPANLTAEAGDARVTLNWTTPYDGRSPILRYRVRLKAGTGSFRGWADIPDSGPDTTSHTVQGLAHGTSHTFEMRAVNEIGAGAPASVSARTPPGTPDAPVELAATRALDGMTLNWTTAFDGGSAITRYRYRFSTDGGDNWVQDWTDVEDSGPGTTSFTVSLAAGTLYTFEVQAVNAEGAGAAARARVRMNAIRPGALGFFNADIDRLAVYAGADNGAVRLVFGIPATDGGATVRYRFRWKEAGGEFAPWTDIPAAELESSDAGESVTYNAAGLGLTTLEHRDHATPPDLVFEGRAVNAAGAGPVSWATVMPLRYWFELTPLDWRADAASPGFDEGGNARFRAALNWTRPPTDGCTFNSAFSVDWGATDAGGFLDETAGTLDFADTDACSGFLDFAVTTTDDSDNEPLNGEVTLALASAGSLSVGDTAPSVRFQVRDNDDTAPPEMLTALRGDGEVRLTWQPPSNEQGNPLAAYQVRHRAGTGRFGAWTDIPASQTDLTVTGLGNGTPHTFQVRTSGALGFGAPAQATETPATPQWEVTRNPAMIVEGGSATVTLRTSNGVTFFSTPEPVTLVLASTHDPNSFPGPVADADYTVTFDGTALTPQSLSLADAGSFTGVQPHYGLSVPAGQSSVTVTVTALDDTEPESYETLRIAVLHDGRHTYPRLNDLAIKESDRSPVLDSAVMDGATVTLTFGRTLRRVADPRPPEEGPHPPQEYFQLFTGAEPVSRHGGPAPAPGQPDGQAATGFSLDGRVVTLTFPVAVAQGEQVWIVYDKFSLYAPLGDGSGSPYGRPVREFTRELQNLTAASALATAVEPETRVADAEATEADGASIGFVVTLDTPAPETVSVDYATADGTAVAGQDYVATSGTLSFARGETEQTVSVTILDDTVEDNGETFRFTLSNPAGATLADAEATGTIRNTESVEDTTPLAMAETAVWSADMTAVDYQTGAIGAASPELFSNEAGSAGLHAKWLWYHAPRRKLSLAFTTGVADADELTLYLGDMQLEFPEGSTGNSSFTWEDIDLDWTDGEVLAVRLAKPSVRGPDTAPVAATVPAATLSVGHAAAAAGRFQVRIAFTQAVSGLVSEDLSALRIGGAPAAVADLTQAEGTLAWTATVAAESAGRYVVRLAPGAAAAVGGGRESPPAVLVADVDAAGNAVAVAGPAVTAASALPPKDGGWTDGDEIRVTLAFSEAVTVETRNGAPTVEIALDGSPRQAAYAGGTETASLAFAYEVTADDGSVTAVSVTADSLAMNGGTIRGPAGRDTDLNHPGTGQVAVAPEPAPRASAPEVDENALRASFEAVPAEHAGAGSEAFILRLVFSELPKLSYLVLRDQSFMVTGGVVRKARRLAPPSNLQWEISVQPSGQGDVSITLPGDRACGTRGAICTADGKALSNTLSVTIKGPAGFSVADARAREGADATLDFEVTLDRAASESVTVDYATADGTATAGADYTASSGKLTFTPGQTARTVSVAVLDDVHDDDGETLTLALSNPTGGTWIRDASATGTIENSDPMPKAWLLRFGRTVADQVADAIGARLTGPPGGSSQVTLGGQRLSLDGHGKGVRHEAGTREPHPETGERLAALTEHLAGSTDGGAWKRREQAGRPRSAETGALEMSGREMLLGSSFVLTLGDDRDSARGGGAPWTAWGRAAAARFDGNADGLSLDGEVTTVSLGADAHWSRWLTGVAVSLSRGTGGFRDHGDTGHAGDLESTLMGVHPYVRYQLSERLTVWGILGYGVGELTLAVDGSARWTTDTSMGMAAAGARGVLVPAREMGGLELATRTDVTLTRMRSDAAAGAAGNLAATEADTRRLRLILEGSRSFALGGRDTLTPSLEVGLRHDAGDAETGTGVEIGGGLRYSDPSLNLTVEATARGLVAHEDADYTEWGASGSVRIEPDASGQGLSLTLSPAWGVPSGGVEHLWSLHDARGLAPNHEPHARSRLDTEIGYGFPVLGGRGVATPHAGWSRSEKSETTRLGQRLRVGSSEWTVEGELGTDGRVLRASYGYRPGNVLDLGVEATWRDPVNGEKPEHGLNLDVHMSW